MSGVDERAGDKLVGERGGGAVDGIGSGDGRSGDGAAAGLVCVNHGGVAGKWHCPACREVFCDECARVIATREDRYASCRKCGARCEPLLDKYVDEDNRGGAVENAEQRRARVQRDWLVPAVVLGVCGGCFLIFAGLGWGVFAGLLAGVIGLVASWVALCGMLILLSRGIGIEIEPLASSALKMGAIASGVHLVRAMLWAMLSPIVSFEGNTAEVMAGGVALLLPTSMAFVLGPIIVLGLLVSKLLGLDSFERVVAIAFLLFAEVITVAALLAF